MIAIHGHFKDKMIYDGANKSAVSVRDGFLEYAGAEIGKEPSDKIFKIYRSPATIANVAGLMKGIPLTDDHVDLDKPVENAKGGVTDAVMIDLNDDNTHSRLAIKNTIKLDDDASEILQTGKRELSLGYKADLVESDSEEYDFEQLNIKPHHLAIVDQGRCGSMCSFIDKKTKDDNMFKNKKANKYVMVGLDSAGAPNMQEIVDMTIALPEAIKAMPIDELKKLAPKLQAIIANAGVGEAPAVDADADAVVDEDEKDADDVAAKDADDMDAKDADDADEQKAKDEEAEKVDVKDSAVFKDALDKAVASSVRTHTEVITKARDFVDEKYIFTGKDTKQIMRDALAVGHGKQKFEDSELPVAFKLLKANVSYKDFADGSNKTALDDLKNKEY